VLAVGCGMPPQAVISLSLFLMFNQYILFFVLELLSVLNPDTSIPTLVHFLIIFIFFHFGKKHDMNICYLIRKRMLSRPSY
jgi:hypothetical protein